MQKITARVLVYVVVSGLCLASGIAADTSGEPEISGQLLRGLRQIEVDPTAELHEFHVYRGDYVQMVVKGGGHAQLVIDALSVDQTIPVGGEKPYLKFQEIGTYSLTLDSMPGTIIVHEFVRYNYSEVSAQEAAELIASIQPFVLDVRTQREYDQVHLQDAHLLPVGDLQRKVSELDEHKDHPIFVYCRSGNRSTVAAKILLDNGFKRIYNLRFGMKEWQREKLPVVK